MKVAPFVKYMNSGDFLISTERVNYINIFCKASSRFDKKKYCLT